VDDEDVAMWHFVMMGGGGGGWGGVSFLS